MRVEVQNTKPDAIALIPQRRNGISVRAFDAGSTNRLNRDFRGDLTTIDADIMHATQLVRERARTLTKNNDYARKYMKLMRMNVVGAYGFKLQVRAKDDNGTLDRPANTRIEEGWQDWGKKKHCTVNGRHTFRGIQHLALDSLIRDGEIFAHRVVDKKAKHGFRIELIEPERIDETYNVVLPNGNIVKMGVELDKTRRPVAYYLRKVEPKREVYGFVNYSRKYERIPAEEMLHVFDQEYINQTRGISWLVQSMLSMNMLGAYDYAAVVAARAGASQSGFIEESEQSQGMPHGDKEDEEGNEIVTFSPNTIGRLNPGEKFVAYNPKYPDAVYEPFTKAQIRRLSSGLGVSYTSLSNDLSDTSYSSARVGLLEEREYYMLIQEMIIEDFLEPIYSDWLNYTLLAGGVRLPSFKFEKFDKPWFVGRRWGWVDPLKEVEAWILMVQAGFKSARSVIAENGDDIEEIYEELAKDKELAKEKGLRLKINELVTAIKNAKPGNGTEEDDERHAMELLKEVRSILSEQEIKDRVAAH